MLLKHSLEGGTTILLGGLGWLAARVPGCRAVRIEPAVALRTL